MRDRLAAAFLRAADALEHSAGLADAHAARAERQGRDPECAQERRSARRAREAADRARENARRMSETP